MSATESPDNLIAELLPRIAGWCLYRERSTAELRRKLAEMELDEVTAAECFQRLLEGNYVSEARFIEEYVHGKFRLKGWGKQKIREGLRNAGVSSGDISEGLLRHLSQDEYYSQLMRWIEKREAELNWRNDLKARQKLVRFLLSKGYESGLITEALRDLESKV